MQNLPIDSLDFDDIKSKFKSFLKENAQYRDYNLEASGISTMLNILAYNTHYIGYYIKMLLNESFIDSSVKRESLLSKAKLNGYVPRGRKSAAAEVKIAIKLSPQQDPTSRSIYIARGTSFASTNSQTDQRLFYIIDDVIVYDRTIDIQGNIIYTTAPIVVYEGTKKNWRFAVDNTIHNQRFVIKDKSIDIDTLRVDTYPFEGSQDRSFYTRADSAIDVTKTENVFYISTNEGGYYEIFFGNNVFGRKPSDNSIIEVNYISSNGETGNGAKKFTFNKPDADLNTANNIGNFSDFTTTAMTVSQGGMEEESIENLKFTIPNHYRQQKRIVTESDYKSIVLSEFRNVDSINVWGGERNIYKEYGKVFISVKPKNANFLTETAKNEIRKTIIDKWAMIGTEPIFVDPEFINVDISIYGKLDLTKTNRAKGEVEKLIQSSIIDYNSTYLNIFENSLSDVEMLDAARSVDSAIKTLYSKKILSKAHSFNYADRIEQMIYFGNPINPGVASSTFAYGAHTCKVIDELGRLFIVKELTLEKVIAKSVGTIDYIKGDIRFILPENVVMTKSNFGFGGEIMFTATPANPDIDTQLNNIVNISSIKVMLNEV